MNNLFRVAIIAVVFSFYASVVHAVYGNLGDLMLLYAHDPIKDPIGVKAEREVRNYEEALLHLKIPQYIAEEGKEIHDEALVRGEFFYHTEIVRYPHEYEEFWGMSWRRYRFTDFAKQVLWPGQVALLHEWIVIDNKDRYLLPLEKTRQMYIDYLNGVFSSDNPPICLMIGTEYGQTVEDYTDFRHFYYKFMQKHHYCVTATFWSILKSLYDRGNDEYKQTIEDSLKDPVRVQSFDTLTAGRLIGLLLNYKLIEEY